MNLPQLPLDINNGLFRALLETSDIVCLLDPSGRVLYVNKTFQQLTGFETAQLIGRTFEETGLLPALLTPLWQTMLDQMNLTQAETTYDFDYTQPDHEIKYFKTRLVPVLSEPTGGVLEAIVVITQDVTVAKRALLELEADRDFCLQVMHALSEGLVITGLDSNIQFVNRAYEQLFGYNSAEVIGNSVFDMVDRAAQPAFVTQWESTRIGHPHDGTEVYLYRKDGSTFLASVRTTPYSRNNEIIGTIALITDLTERKQAEAALRQSEENYRQLAHHFPNGAVFLYDRDLRFLVVGGKILSQFGYTSENLEGRTIYESLPPESVAILEPKYRAALGGAIIREEVHSRITGQTYLTTYVPVENEKGEIVAGMIVSHDITELKQAMEALRESEEKHRMLADSMEDIISLRDLDGNLLYISPSIERLTGRTIEEAYNEDNVFFFHPDDRGLFTEVIEQLKRGKLPGPLEWRVRMEDGSYLWIETRMKYIYDREGQPFRLLLVSRNIHQRKLTEEALRRSEEDLRQAQKMEAVGQLAGGIAHDFNNLLTGILGYAELAILVSQDQKAPQQLLNYIEEIKAGAERAATLVYQLLAFSRKQVLQPKTLRLNEVIAGMENLLRSLIGENIEFVVNSDRNLHTVEVDPGQIQQVIMNLALNARDAMPEGGRLVIETRNVTLDEAAIADQQLDVVPGNYVLLSVTDTGSGFSPETQQHIFEPFFTTKPVGKGTGLGLSTAYGILRQSKGDIWVTSQVNGGTTFKVYLPSNWSSPPEAEDKAAQEDVVRPRHNRETVLLVEDQDMVRAVIRQLLEMEGFQVIEAENGRVGLQKQPEYPPNLKLVISDVRMPVMNGPVMVEELRAAYPNLKVLFISGYAEGDIKERAMVDPDVEFLQKPFTRQQLMSVVKNMLGITG